MGWLVRQDRRADVERFWEQLDSQGGPRFRTVDGRRELDHPWRDEPGLPESLVVDSPER
jgi:hypothetical protein